MDAKYNRDLQQAKARLIQLMQQERALQVEIAKQKRAIAALSELAELTPPIDLVSGVTDAVRTVLRSAMNPVSASEIYLRAQGLGLPQQQNLLASVHTTLRRLVEAGEVEFDEDKNTGGYRLKAPIPNPPFSPKLGYTRLTGKRDSK
jgi:hypothetical protein